jgi:S-(hydroxymethyl)glutathione dehydrogenase/alcohol dehydrogenase
VAKEIPFDLACLIGCGVMTGVGAATRKARVDPGASVLVIGCGAVGLNVIQGARLAGAGLIVAADVSDAKLDRAKLFGAHLCMNATADVVERLRTMTQGRGPDYVFEAAGHERAFRLALEAVRPGGQVVFLGKVNVNQDVAFRWGSLMGEKRIVRSSYGGGRPRRDFPWLAQQYLEGNLRLDELVTRRIPLEQINSGFDAIRRGDTVREVVVFPT